MGSIRFPLVSQRLGLGVGMDLPWGGAVGIESAEERVTRNTLAFFEKYKRDFAYYFFSFQPKNRNVPDPDEYFTAYDRLVAEWPAYAVRALHHTQLNLGTQGYYDKEQVVQFTNRLIERHGFSWVNEDLGLWSIEGKVLPYPLPPILSPSGLKASIENTRYYQQHLRCPLLVEFPGFSEGVSFLLGRLDALEFFSRVVTETDSPATFDTGHLLSYQWLRGRKGAERFAGLEALPFDHCFEIHLSGCQVVNGKFVDFHHGILMDEQLELLDYLLERCPQVKAVTYEDPKFLLSGELVPKAIPNYRRLKERVRQWMQA